MIFILLGILILVPLLSFIGSPFYRLLTISSDPFSALFWKSLLGIACIQFSWVTSIGIGYSRDLALWILAIIVLSSHICVHRSKKLLLLASPKLTRFKWHEWTRLAIALVCSLVVTLPYAQSLTVPATSYRIGPDAIGNGVAGVALANNVTLPQIQDQLLLQTDTSSVKEALNFETHVLYSTLDLRTQIRTEFLVAGMRYGFPSLLATLHFVDDSLTIWGLIPILIGFYAFLIQLGAISVCRMLGTGPIPSWIYQFCCCASPIVLAAVLEGGTSQYAALPSALGVVLVFGTQKKSSRSQIILLSFTLFVALVTYSDLWILLTITLFLFGLMTYRRFGKQPILVSVIATTICVLAALTYSLGLAPLIFRRLEDASIGGWSFPVWLSPAEVVGVANGLNQSAANGIRPRSALLSLVTNYWTPILIGFGGAVIWLKRKEPLVILFYISLTLTCALYFKTRYIDTVSNYQYLKIASSLLPLLLLPIAFTDQLILGTSGKQRSKGTFLIIVAIGISAGIASVNYLASYLSTSSTVSISQAKTLMRPENRRALDSVNIVASPEISTMALSAYSSIRWFGRGAFNQIEGHGADFDKPLQLLIAESDCPDFSCLASVDEIRFIGQEFALVPLFTSSEVVRGVKNRLGDKQEIESIVNQRFVELGGSPMLGFVPRVD